MPELPEMKALAERLDEAFSGAGLARIDVLAFAALKTFATPPEGLIGRTLESVSSRGKYLILEFGESRVLVHLSQGGRVELPPRGRRGRPRGGVVRFVFDRDPALLVKEFGTERKAGWWVLTAGDEGPLARLGPDPRSEAFAELIVSGTDGGRLHTMLRDQRRVAGIGRGYADDILHAAGLSPFRSLSSLSEQERERLLGAVRSVLREASEQERRRTGGLPPKLGDHFSVHGRSGHPCPTCGADLRRVSFSSHEITYCPACQTGGRVLGDRRMSRLLR